jgi:hypothetical protein
MPLVRNFSLVLVLALSAIGVQAQTTALLLINAGPAPIQVQRDDRSVMAELAPGTSATVSFSGFQWIRRGNTAYRYNTSNVQRLKRKGQTIVLQLDAKAGLFLMTPDHGAAVAVPPAQPKGFPLRPDRTFALR